MKHPLNKYPYKIEFMIPTGHRLGNRNRPLWRKEFARDESSAIEQTKIYHSKGFPASVTNRKLKTKLVIS